MLITNIKNETGEVITSREVIANVFGEFYSKLHDDEQYEEIDPEFTTEWLQAAINRLERQIPDSNGIISEDIKACDDETREMVRQIFNEIVKQNEFTPEAWKKVRIKVIHKKGDVEYVGNYRPICSLPALHKLFTTILYSRLHPRLDQIQAEVQAGFRSFYQTTDHLATYRMIDQNATSGESKCGPRQSTS